MSEAQEHWEERYREPLWSGKVNETLEWSLAGVAPGRSLDLGCGEGADVAWLEAQGWDAVGVDISETAISRARARSNARFIVAELPEGLPAGPFDLVTASFFHSHAPLDRTTTLRRASHLVSPGGRMLIISHAWHHSAQEELQAVGLDDWDTILVGERGRQHPQRGWISDAVVHMRRKAC